MVAELLVTLYRLVHGKLHLPGMGWLIRRMVRFAPKLKAYPLSVDGFGTAILDFRDTAAFGLLNVVLGDYGADNTHLFLWLDSQLKPGDVLWDVGANVGYFALYFARPPHRLKAIHSFEPNPQALRTLQSLFANHPLVKVHAVGLGGHDEQLPMSVASESQIGTLLRAIEGGKTITVNIRRGDDYRREQAIAPPDIIKIDVEGFEPQVLTGLAATIRENRPLIVLEHIWLTDEQLVRLTPKGYDLWFLLPDGTLNATRMEGWNAVLMPSITATRS